MVERNVNPFPQTMEPTQEGIVIPSSNGVAFDARQVLKQERDMRHSKNLHGEGKYVDGLTGFYHGKFYRDGIPQPRRRP